MANLGGGAYLALVRPVNARLDPADSAQCSDEPWFAVFTGAAPIKEHVGDRGRPTSYLIFRRLIVSEGVERDAGCV